MSRLKPNEKMLARVIYQRIAAVTALLLLVFGGVLWGAGVYAKNYVRQELSAQNIYFPAKGSPALDPKTYPDLQQYAGQKVDDGPKAEAYANGYIGRHLKKTAGGKTYSEISSLAMKDPSNQTLQKQKQTLFQGETLRGLLLGNGYGYWTLGVLAQYTALACAILTLALLTVVYLPHLRAKRA